MIHLLYRITHAATGTLPFASGSAVEQRALDWVRPVLCSLDGLSVEEVE